MKKILSIMLCMTMALCLFGCKGRGIKPEDVMELLIEQDIPEGSISQEKHDEYTVLNIDDEEFGEAEIRFYRSEKAEQRYLDNIEDEFDQVSFDDDVTAVGTNQEGDTTIEYWIRVEQNCIIIVKQYEMSSSDAYLEYICKTYHIDPKQIDKYIDMNMDELSKTLGIDLSAFGDLFDIKSLFEGLLDFESSSDQRKKAEELEEVILDCFEELSE